MIIIAHRGLTDGPDIALQNNPEQISRAFVLGFDAEVDVWYIESDWWLGHDGPEYKVDEGFILRPGLWIHCKNLPAWNKMRGMNFSINYFWHETDAVTLTSQNICWTYMGNSQAIRPDAVCVMPELAYDWNTIETMVHRKYWYGYCTDYPKRIKECIK